jgi:nitrogen fixation NifU-like protein
MAYSDKVIDHYENPRNVGSFNKDDKDVGTGMVGAPACGDVMKLQIKVDENGIIRDARFKTYGCGSAIASSSLVTEWVKGMHIDDASNLRNSQIAEELSLPPNTVSTIKKVIYRKLKVSTSLDFFKFVLEQKVKA